MTTRAEYQSTWSRSEPSSYKHQSDTSTPDMSIGSAMNNMITAPFWMTAAGINWMTSGMQRLGQSMSGPSSSTSSSSQSGSWNGGTHQASADRSSWTDWANPANWRMSSSSRPANDQDLSGDDLKYVMWTIIFTKPGYEAVLEPLHSDLVSYSTDSSSYAAMKIAKFLERARFGKVEKPHGWVEHDYPPEPAAAARRAEASKQETKSDKEGGWRIPSDDQKYVQFLYRVEWRLPKQTEETTRVERVTVERTSNAHANIVV